MRLSILLLLLLSAGCTQEEESAPEQARVAAPTGSVVFASGARDRVCLKQDEGRAAIITYAAAGDASCMIKGVVEGAGTIRPDGDQACRLIFRVEGRQLTVTEAGPACAYYCGPGASLQGKTFVRMDKPEPVTDIAGDPLC